VNERSFRAREREFSSRPSAQLSTVNATAENYQFKSASLPLSLSISMRREGTHLAFEKKEKEKATAPRSVFDERCSSSRVEETQNARGQIFIIVRYL